MNNLINLISFFQPTDGTQQNPYSMFIMLGLVFVVFYFFMIRPQVKRQKELKNFRESLKKGDKIITSGGIYGKITALDDTIATIDVGNGVTIKFDKSAILKDPSDLQAQQQK